MTLVSACACVCREEATPSLGDTGIVERSPGWRDRFKCLNQSNSCHRHITRMLKCLGELNHENLKVHVCIYIEAHTPLPSFSLSFAGTICGLYPP